MDKIVRVRWNHGGIFVNNNIYNGGDVHIDETYDIDRFSLFEFLATTRELGYSTVSGFYVKGSSSGGFRHLFSDEVILEWVKELNNGETVDIFVDHQADKPQLYNPKILEPKSPHNENIPAQDSDNNYAANSFPAPNSESAPNIDEAPNANVLDENINFDNSSEKEGEHNAVEEEDLECDGDTSSEVDEELRQSREIVREYNRRKKERAQRSDDDNDEIPLGETGTDIGFECLDKRNDKYKGLVGGDEAYYDSSDPGSNAEDEKVENDEQPQARKSTERIRYDPNAPVPIFELGMIFTNVYEFREAVAKYSISKGKDLRKRPNDINRVRVKCKKVGCPWLLYAGIEESSNDFIVKNYHPVHRCTRSNKNKLCTSKYIANYVRERIISQPGIKLREIVDLVREKLKVSVGKTKCRRAKELVIKSVIGDPLVEYARLHDYVEEIKKSNVGTTCFVNYDDTSEPGKHLFKRFYVCFRATKQGWKDGVRKIIGLDGCFLKGPCQGQLLVAVSKDGNDQMFPIAWGIVDIENKKNWRWFIEFLKLDLDIEDGEKLTVMTDMQKGLIPAIRELLPAAEHRMCGRHVWANWSKKWRGGRKEENVLGDRSSSI